MALTATQKQEILTSLRRDMASQHNPSVFTETAFARHLPVLLDASIARTAVPAISGQVTLHALLVEFRAELEATEYLTGITGFIDGIEG